MNIRDQSGAPSRSHIMLPASLLALMWLVQLANVLVCQPLFHMTLNQYGIVPRSFTGLRGIVFAPFLHASFTHLLGNSLPFLILGWLVTLRGGASDFVGVTVLAALAGGLGAWLFGADGVHVGASGLVYGYLGFLLLTGYFDRRPLSVVLSLVVGCLYGGLLWGVLPLQQGVSWQSHVFGFLGGALAARLATPARLPAAVTGVERL